MSNKNTRSTRHRQAGLTGARPVLRVGQDLRIPVELRMLLPHKKTLRATEPWAQLLGLGVPEQP